MATSDLLDFALDAHGSLERWRSARQVRVDLQTGGRVFEEREPLRRNKRAGRLLFETDEPRVTLLDYWQGETGIFDNGNVRIENQAGEVIDRRDNARAAFSRMRQKFLWDKFDGLYFRGYALWNYVAAPFMFTFNGFQTREGKPHQERGEIWRTLEVTFPEGFPTHSRQQTFYFDEQSGLLRRLDYTAEVIYSFAATAHYTWDHKEFSGIMVPTRRKAMLRLRRRLVLPTPALIWIKIQNFELVPQGLAPATGQRPTAPPAASR